MTLTPVEEGTYWGTSVESIQSDLAVENGDITGTLLYYDDPDKALVRDWGEGYFIAVAFGDITSGLTYENVQVGLEPSAGSGLVTLDDQQDAVMHVTSPNQKIVAVQTDPDTGDVKVQKWTLDQITYAPKE